MNLRGYLYIVIAAALWGLIGPLAKLAFREGLAPLEVAFWRAILAWGVFALHAVLQRQIRMRPRDFPAVLVFGLAGVTLFYGSYQLAVQKGGAALAAVLLYTAPAWVAVMSRFFFKEPITPVKQLALMLTLTGVTGVALGAGSPQAAAGIQLSSAALLFGLIAGFCYALYYIFGKHFSGRYSAPNLFFYILPLGALGMAPWVTFTHKTPTAWAALLLLAIFGTYGAYLFYYAGLKYLEPTRAAITATLEPVIAALIAYVWWGEYFTFTGYAGSLLILLSVLLMVWDGARQCRR